ncbi:MAG TPA: prepilin-type N-terminal cleavage/methylation domain-containing protein [Candidatus Polarisedimenticolia bacterium]|nr:prepilin-type N-terminal cleavage/methylation domain-containing protein [Candidatus Polarisedimenticolia bacterium]
MRHLQAGTKRSTAGFSLIEMLLASAIFAIVAAVVFIFYTAAQKSYKSGENFSDQQQATRVAFDRMVADLRLAGYNTNPDGDTTRVDEQVEGAWDTAVTVRADYDFEDPTARVTPEASLPGLVYNTVSTGNDEVVTYVLAKPGPAGPDTLTIRLDTDRPRTKAVKTVIIPNVAVVQNNPPYTLYRVTLADVNGAYPSSPQASSAFVFEPVADNIRSMQFQYWPDSGAQLGPNTPANSGDDIGGADANSVTRSKIRRITVNLVGMTPDDDLDYTDASDATATTHYRKLDLQSDVNAENLGRSGVKDIDITPPPNPLNVSAVPGHCGGMLVKWDTPTAESGVTSYTVKYYPNGSPSSFNTAAVTYPHNEYGVVDYDGHGFIAGLTMGSNYCFQVQARDLVGNQSGWSPASSPPCAVVSNTTPPAQPLGFTASGDGTTAAQDSRVVLNWQQVQTNNGTVTNDPDLMSGNTILRDGKGYKLYKDTTAGFTPNDATNLVAGTGVLGNGATTYTDTQTANCQTYYYKLVAADTCDTGSAAATVSGQAVTAIAPSRPTALNAVRSVATLVNLTWQPVTTKTDGTTTYINLYKIYRAALISTTNPLSIGNNQWTLIATTTSPTFANTLVSADLAQLQPGFAFFYTVTAADLCGNESAKADPMSVNCAFSGTFLPSPTDGSSGAGQVNINLNVSGPDTYTRAHVWIPNVNGVGNAYDHQAVNYPFSFPGWNTAQAGAGNYIINWEVENSAGCTQLLQTRFSVSSSLACQITPTNPNLSPTNGKASNQNKNLSWDIVNNSGKDLTIDRINVSWGANIGTHLLQTIQYPTGYNVSNFGAGAASMATGDYSVFPLSLPMTADGTCGTCKVNMMLGFSTQMVDPNSGAGELITIQYRFTDISGVTGNCQFTVFPDLSIVTP